MEISGTMNAFENKNQQAENEIKEIEAMILRCASERTLAFKKQLKLENDLLKSEISELKRKFGTDKVSTVDPTPSLDNSTKPKNEKPKKEKKEKVPKPPKTAEVPSAVDVSRLDFRVGKILNVEKHSGADSLYIEQVDVGESAPRVVVSGLVKHYKESDLNNQTVVLLCNLKPAAMRGTVSQAMVMCASTPDKVEFLCPPSDSKPGDIIEFEGYTRNPDSVLNPKKKIFETIAPDLKTDTTGVATYKGVPFTVPGKGVVKAPSLFNVQIK